MVNVFLFPGQGAQFPGMALDLVEGDTSGAAAKVFGAASEVAGRDIAAQIRDSDGGTLKRSDVSQTAICAAELAAAAALGARGIEPAACAGFSLGEYAALVCAGVLGMADCFALTEARGRAMQEAADEIAARGSGDAPGMAAVIGLAPAFAEELIAGWKSEGLADLYAANINSPKQIVVSGTAAALAEAEKRFKEAGARRFIRLAVAGPFHSPLMEKAAAAFAPHLEKVHFSEPKIPLFSNVSGKRIESAAQAKKLAIKHIVKGVRWTDEEQEIAALKPDAVLEVGPGKTLQGLWKDAFADGQPIPCYGAFTMEEIAYSPLAPTLRGNAKER